MRLIVCAAMALLFLTSGLEAHAAPLGVPAPSLDGVASGIAGQPVEVRCYSSDPVDADPEAAPDAWGYVYLSMPIVFLDKRVCEGALAVQSGAMLPLWQLALGAMVLTHEAYHLKVSLPDWRRGNEAQTQCRAVKRSRQTLMDLGATSSLADVIMPWVIAEHYKESTFGPYNYPSCNVPGMEWWPH